MNIQPTNPPVPAPRRDTKGSVFALLSRRSPLNEFGLPEYIYRADLVPLDINDSLSYSPEERHNFLQAATLRLSFPHGYPTIHEEPLWSRFEWEPLDAHAAFVRFLELPETSNHENPIRILPLIAEATNLPLEKIIDWADTYYWFWRARAYDLFLVACLRKQREQRISSIEGAHFTLAERLLKKISDYADKRLDLEIEHINSIESITELETDTKLRDIVSMAIDLTRVQRVALGLPATGPIRIDGEGDGVRPHATVEDTFKGISSGAKHETTPERRGVEMDRLLANPDDLTLVQSLLVRMGRGEIVEKAIVPQLPLVDGAESTPSIDLSPDSL
jgi:hypothetical protein